MKNPQDRLQMLFLCLCLSSSPSPYCTKDSVNFVRILHVDHELLSCVHSLTFTHTLKYKVGVWVDEACAQSDHICNVELVNCTVCDNCCVNMLITAANEKCYGRFRCITTFLVQHCPLRMWTVIHAQQTNRLRCPINTQTHSLVL